MRLCDITGPPALHAVQARNSLPLNLGMPLLASHEAQSHAPCTGGSHLAMNSAACPKMKPDVGLTGTD